MSEIISRDPELFAWFEEYCLVLYEQIHYDSIGDAKGRQHAYERKNSLLDEFPSKLLNEGSAKYWLHDPFLQYGLIMCRRTFIKNQARKRWKFVFAFVCILAVNKRAVESANHPARKKQRGEFEIRPDSTETSMR